MVELINGDFPGMLNNFNYKYVLLGIALLYGSCTSKNDSSVLSDVFVHAIRPLSSVNLDASLDENSGAIVWNDTLWLQNDSSEPILYGVDPSNGQIISKIEIAGLQIQDWESLAHDEDFVYFGDFGNNSNYRANLRIFRLAKESILNGQIKLDTLRFFYEDQQDYTYNETLETDFDCESMVIIGDSIFLFTKQWTSQETAVYSLPKMPGDYCAKKIEQFKIDGLITEALKFPNENTIVLTGYNEWMNPFFVLLHAYDGSYFFSGNVIKIQADLWMNQIEAICLKNKYQCYVSSEGFLRMSPELHVFDFEPYVDAARSLQTGIEN
ncbi:hypothetical protein [Carboxylicivirga marina]|uniref:hypothetical protein n=1 Tax=Carboxylicivirga marina TaxID=2800988 RepID=UPI002596695B|nr:hypothetical protein [uncultured Carboxylicivirga sp.]